MTAISHVVVVHMYFRYEVGCLIFGRLTQEVLVSRDIGISGGCVGPHDVTPDLPARARVAEGEDGDVTPARARRRPHGEGDDRSGGVIVLGRLPPHLVRSPRLHLHQGAVRRVP